MTAGRNICYILLTQCLICHSPHSWLIGIHSNTHHPPGAHFYVSTLNLFSFILLHLGRHFMGLFIFKLCQRISSVALMVHSCDLWCHIRWPQRVNGDFSMINNVNNFLIIIFSSRCTTWNINQSDLAKVALTLFRFLTYGTLPQDQMWLAHRKTDGVFFL